MSISSLRVWPKRLETFGDEAFFASARWTKGLHVALNAPEWPRHGVARLRRPDYWKANETTVGRFNYSNACLVPKHNQHFFKEWDKPKQLKPQNGSIQSMVFANVCASGVHVYGHKSKKVTLFENTWCLCLSLEPCCLCEGNFELLENRFCPYKHTWPAGNDRSHVLEPHYTREGSEGTGNARTK